MSTISASTGLYSGLDFNALTEALLSSKLAVNQRLQNRVSNYQTTQAAVKSLSANLLTLSSSAQQLGSSTRFEALSINNSDSAQLTVGTSSTAQPGNFTLQTVQTSATHRVRSQGYSNADQQKIGAGTLVIAQGGGLSQPTALDFLNGGDGVSRGILQITDRSGANAQIDLANAYSVQDVVDAINDASGISVTASTEGDHLVLTDTSGSTASNLIVSDTDGSGVAESLGLEQSVAADSLTGSSVFYLTEGFTLDLLNDGNGIQRSSGVADLSITLTDDTVLEINLDDATSLSGVIDAINDHEDNGGKVLAELDGGGLKFTDLSGGGGSSAFAVANLNTSSVVEQLGLDAAESGGIIQGDKLLAGLNSVLLRNLRGGQGVDQLGEISVTDRAGNTATLDLTSAQSLDEVVAAINAATAADTTKLNLVAQINSVGTGIQITDTSGSTASNLIIADVGGSTLADQLGIEVDAALTSIDSGSLNLRYLNEAASIASYAPDGGTIDFGSIRITDSNGDSTTVEISSAVKTLGDVLIRLNAASGVSISAELNETGDGFVLIDEAGGAGELTIEEVDGTTAADLRLLGDSYTGSDGKLRITSRNAVVVETDSSETLNDLLAKLEEYSGVLSTAVINDGSAFNSTRLSLSSAQSGRTGKLFIEDGIGLALQTVSTARDALLRVGDDTAGSFLLASNDNSFDEIAEGVDVTVLAAGTTAAEVELSRDTSGARNAVQAFVQSYNAFVTSTDELTRYDVETNERGALQGQGIVLRISSRFGSLINQRSFTSDKPFHSLIEFGVRFTSGGKLSFDQDTFDAAFAEDHAAAAEFFLDDDEGFSKRLDDVVESLVDPFEGTITLETNSLQASIDDVNRRITQQNELILLRRDRLLQQFVKMEETLAVLQTQQQSLSAITSLSINQVGKGIL